MTNSERMMKAVEQIRDDRFWDILESIVDCAFEFFIENPKDFCVQHVGYTRIIFGGTNRLIWSIRTGFTIDKPYCTPDFIKHAEKILNAT